MVKDNSVQMVSALPKGVTLSKRASDHIKQQIAKRGETRGIRLSVAKTGCSGLSYVVDFVDEINESDKAFIVAGIDIFIDFKSYPYLKGIEVDYVKQGLNHKFIFTNPNQTGECGCGESFTVDEQFSTDDEEPQ